ncbi:hypothetical protein FALBO_550 [Fusarium albosuccineum]|uniref:Uncharacterized protein n=1 Tax=Fusarium albosuccineum TaxID=1237068 RepID=A0A8H4PIY9_9HYPO|nr:hypothetical protein FALBO_550 [Fusarium albosuccineum]
MSNHIRYVWGWLLSRLKPYLLLVLVCSAFTIPLGLVEGVFLGQWILQSSRDTTKFLLRDSVAARAYTWLSVPDRPSFLDARLQPYYIQRLQNPTDWVDRLGLKRPHNWNTERVEQVASLDDLYRRRRGYSNAPPWHHWIYASAQRQPMEGEIDEWDKAFSELLLYADKHELLGRANFHYVGCPENFLCNAWRVTGPALIHFTTELPPESQAVDKSKAKTAALGSMPKHDPVTVRLFEFPLRDPVIPGVFPSYFEQMRFITGNSTFWSSQEPYSEYVQLFRQVQKMFKNKAELYRQTYGRLVTIEKDYLELLGLSDSLALGRIQLASTALSCIPTGLALRVWRVVGPFFRVPLGDKTGQKSKMRANPTRLMEKPVDNDPVARILRNYVDRLTEEDEKRLKSHPDGSKVLEKIQTALDEKSFNSKDEVFADIFDALGKGPDGKTKGE